MQFFLEKASRLRCNWNKQALTEEDFYRLCRRRKITVKEMPLRTSGFYYCVLGKHYIAVDSTLERYEKLFVMFHEFAHYLMHAPDAGVTANFHGVGQKTRKETEADAFALCALIPKCWIETRTVHDIAENEGVPEQMLLYRLALYEMHGK